MCILFTISTTLGRMKREIFFVRKLGQKPLYGRFFFPEKTRKLKMGIYSVAISSNGLNFIKKRAKIGRFFSKKTGKNWAKLKISWKKTGVFCDQAPARP